MTGLVELANDYEVALGETLPYPCATEPVNFFQLPLSGMRTNEHIVLAQVDGAGPNHSVWYVLSNTLKVDLRSAVWRELTERAEEAHPNIAGYCAGALPQVTHYYALGCALGAIGRQTTLNAVASHEDRHVDSALIFVKQADNNVPKIWEELSGSSDTDLFNVARGAAFNVHTTLMSSQQALDRPGNRFSGETHYFEFFALGRWFQHVPIR